MSRLCRHRLATFRLVGCHEFLPRQLHEGEVTLLAKVHVHGEIGLVGSFAKALQHALRFCADAVGAVRENPILR